MRHNTRIFGNPESYGEFLLRRRKAAKAIKRSRRNNRKNAQRLRAKIQRRREKEDAQTD